MIVYVESNFVLELVYGQSEHDACEKLLEKAKSNEIELVLPAYLLTEPYETVERRAKDRRKLHEALRTELGQLSRSSMYSAKKASFNLVTNLLVESIEHQRKALDSMVTKLLATGRLLPVTPEIISESLVLKQRHGLSQQDAFVYASVLLDARQSGTGDKCFVTKNRLDFENQDMASELAGCNCKMLWDFRTALSYCRSTG